MYHQLGSVVWADSSWRSRLAVPELTCLGLGKEALRAVATGRTRGCRGVLMVDDHVEVEMCQRSGCALKGRSRRAARRRRLGARCRGGGILAHVERAWHGQWRRWSSATSVVMWSRQRWGTKPTWRRCGGCGLLAESEEASAQRSGRGG
jgi:hypothetical protein